MIVKLLADPNSVLHRSDYISSPNDLICGNTFFNALCRFLHHFIPLRLVCCIQCIKSLGNKFVQLVCIETHRASQISVGHEGAVDSRTYDQEDEQTDAGEK